MGIAALIGMGLSFVGVALVWTTFRETKRRADAAHDANRPWIKLTAGPNEGFEFRKDGFSYGLDITITNIGNSPALDVSYISNFVFHDPTAEELLYHTPKWFDVDGIEWRDKIVFQGDVWERNSGAVYVGGPLGHIKANLVVAVRYRTAFDRNWRFTVRVYSLHPLGTKLPNFLDLSNLLNVQALGCGYFDEHQRIAGIAT